MAGRLDDGTRFHGTAVDFGGDQVYGTGYVQEAGEVLVGTDRAERSEILGPHGLPVSGTWRVGDLELRVEPIAFSPVLLSSPDGRTSRFPRAWARFIASDGRSGDGWIEWNQPQP